MRRFSVSEVGILTFACLRASERVLEATWRLISERITTESLTTCERWPRSPQPHRPNVSERVGEEAEESQCQLGHLRTDPK